MKKTIAIAATLAMTAMLSMTAFADGADHTTGGVPDVSPTKIHKGDEETFEQGEWIDGVEATCGQDGIWRYQCASNPDQFHEIYVSASTIEHTWSSEEDGAEWGKVVKEPTCTEEGEAIDYCKVCGKEGTKTRKIDKHDHEYDEWTEIEGSFKKATCLKDGEVKYHLLCTFCGEPAKDNNGKENIIKDTWEWVDPGTEDDEFNEAHKWDSWVHEKAATCDATGTDIRWCTRCGAKERKTVDMLEPVFTKVVKSEMLDCYTEEITYTCAVCEGKNNADHKEHKVTKNTKAHTFETEKDEELSKDATCTEWGYDVYLCKHFDEDDRHSNPVGKPVEKKNLDGTVTSLQILDGYKVEWHEPLGHDWTEWTKRYTSDNSTYWLRTCKRCKDTEEQISKDKPEEPVYPTDEKNGLIQDEDGTWRLYKDDKVNDKFTGIYEYNGGEFFINKGVLDEKANGLNLIDGTWYFLAQGQVQRTDGFAEYDDNWFMIKNGELDEKANGLYTYKTDEGEGVFLFAAGRLRTDVNGLWQDAYGTYGEAGKWYFLANGQVVDYTGVAEYNGAFFVVEKGVFNNEYNGTIEYDGATFNVVAGQLYDQVKTDEAA